MARPCKTDATCFRLRKTAVACCTLLRDRPEYGDRRACCVLFEESVDEGGGLVPMLERRKDRWNFL